MNYELQRPSIEVRDLTKQYMAKTVFQNLSLDIAPEKLTLIKGPSGSGKTTLLNVMSGIDSPTSGEVYVEGREVTNLSNTQRALYRAAAGQIFQRSGLIAGLTSMENVQLPHDLSGQVVDKEWRDYLLDRLKVKEFADQPAAQLSGGQMQRVALVRALAHFPRLVFADEPTASLDTESKKDVHELLRFVADTGATVVMVSHEEMSQDYADNVLEMRDGVVAS